MNNNVESWEVMNIIAEKKKRKRRDRKLYRMIDQAKISCYDNLEVYYGLDYMNYIPKKDFLEFMEIWKELFNTCCICGEDECNCLEERRLNNAGKN